MQARVRVLMSVAELAALLPAAPLLLEAGYGARAQFEQAHIPGARYLDTGDLEHGPLWLKVPDAELLAVLLAQGIRHDSTVILYGRNNLAAARAAHLMLYAGVRDVRLLDGGYQAWADAGQPCVAGPAPEATAAGDFGAAFPGCPSYLINYGQARALLAQRDGVLASIRTESEHLGIISGYSYIAARGDIPGARWARSGDDGDVNSMSACQRPDGTMKPARAIERQWQAAGITRERQVAFYCGTGWRASMAFIYAYAMGWPRISVYDGGWCEWNAEHE
jgi:thiosulfate/3-mercaptopyruvate sulfurtransferase